MSGTGHGYLHESYGTFLLGHMLQYTSALGITSESVELSIALIASEEIVGGMVERPTTKQRIIMLLLNHASHPLSAGRRKPVASFFILFFRAHHNDVHWSEPHSYTATSTSYYYGRPKIPHATFYHRILPSSSLSTVSSISA